ncbi:MAG: penicillin-binding protein 2 [Verrucomicrobiota bacterium]
MNTPLRRRALLVILLFTTGFTTISTRLIFLQMVDHQVYLEEAGEMHYDTVVIPPRRGSVMDVKGRVLAQTLIVIDLHIDGKLVKEDPEPLTEVAEILNVPLDQLQSQISEKNRFKLISRELNEDVVKQLAALEYRPLRLEQRLLRVYPNSHEGSHVIGFTNQLNKEIDGGEREMKTEEGIIGVERIMDKYLRGIPGERRVVRDRDGHEIAAYRQYNRPATNGLNVVLSLDAGVQNIIESEADRLIEEFSPESLNIVVVRPSTGEILGLTNRPSFNPNNRAELKTEQLRNGAVMDLFEPGSGFKIITLAAALNEGIAALDTPIFCENGKFFYAERWLHDSKPHGLLPLSECFAVSSNIAFAKLGLSLEKERLYKYIRQFGFGETLQNPEMALKGEARGILRPPNYWSNLSPTRIPIGYEIAATNLQMAMAVAAIANEGKLMEPILVKALVDENERMVKQYLPKVVRKVVDQDVAEDVIKAMQDVVVTGTGKAASVDGFPVAGKTGTARKVIEGSYAKGAYYSSFIGFLPAEDPEFLVSVVVNQPQGESYYASKVAAPSFGRIGRRVAQQLDLVKPQNSAFAKLPEGESR